MVFANRPQCQYRVDREDRIVWVNAWWLAFAEENGAAELTREAVIGRSLWDFIDHEDTRRLYRGIHTHVRDRGAAVVLPSRCDSPTVRRFLQLQISVQGRQDELQYDAAMIRVEVRRAVWMLDPNRPRDDSFLWMCSCCKRALLESRGWLEAEEIAIRLHLDDKCKLPCLRQTLCPECEQTLADASGSP
jgi:hypothetical protein